MINNKVLKIKMIEADVETFEKLAEKMGMTKGNLCNKFRGRNNWTLDNIKKIKEILNLKDSELIEIFFN